MLEQLGWKIVRLSMLVGLLGTDFILGFFLIETIKDREWLPALASLILGLVSLGLTVCGLGWLTGW